jgi:peroxiredoxin
MSSQPAPIAQQRDTPLTVGERAPQFTLKTANAAAGRSVGQSFTLADLIARGPVVVEFLRGTW